MTEKPKKVEWASQNMLVLGIIVVLGMLLHLFNFWYNMMFVELLHGHDAAIVAAQAGVPGPTDGHAWIVYTFQNPVYVVLYIIWLVALWFHLTHGFWSAIQSIGWSGHIWFNRWRVIGNVYVTVVMLMFLAVVLGFACGLA